MKIPAEIELKMNVNDAVTKLQRLGEMAHKAVAAVNDFNKALENCKRMDVEISIKSVTASTKKWWQIWKG
jgi:hypothetical protein